MEGRVFHLLLDHGGVFSLLPHEQQTQELTHSIFQKRKVSKAAAGSKEMFNLIWLPQLDGTLFYCFQMPVGIAYTPNRFIPRMVLYKKIYKNVKDDEARYPYIEGIQKLIWAIIDLDRGVKEVYPMIEDGKEPPFDFELLASGEQEYRFYCLNRFRNGERGIPVLIDHTRKCFWNCSRLWPELQVADGIGILLWHLRPIVIEQFGEKRHPMIVSYLGGPRLCKECNLVKDVSKPETGPWMRFRDSRQSALDAEQTRYELYCEDERYNGRQPAKRGLDLEYPLPDLE